MADDDEEELPLIPADEFEEADVLEIDIDEEVDEPGAHVNTIALGQGERRTSRTSLRQPRRQSHTEVTFNVQLPVAHSYLGEDLEELHGRTIHDDDSCQSIPIIGLPGVILIPGQTLPLHVFAQSTVNMIKRILELDKTFGLVCLSYNESTYDEIHAKIGTTAEILSIKEENDDRSGISSIRMIAAGRQRFQILDTRRQVDGTLLAKVKILAEKSLPDFLEGARCRSQRTLKEPVWPVPVQFDDLQFNAAFYRHKKKALGAAYTTWWPPWVYENYDVDCLMKKMKDEFSSWSDTFEPDKMPSDAVEFSFWVAGNIMMDDNLKLKLLAIDSAVQRLRCELAIMQKCSVLCCRDCGEMIFNKNEVFTMSVQGPMGTYVNPGGYVHEMFTVSSERKEFALNLRGRPSSQHSWFPGYAWTIAECKNCSDHMGWRFTVVNKKQGLKPEMFWGICRSAVIPKLQQEFEDSDDEMDDWEPCV
ncbi:protein cereblon-like isoform X2 [Tubulanus polymorphus]|uniref:protein cereblon-like isoform X2 n=1 Tax=Tubulanus polymorphus TaxID=672921 RepID=UPI003DA4F0F9